MRSSSYVIIHFLLHISFFISTGSLYWLEHFTKRYKYQFYIFEISSKRFSSFFEHEPVASSILSSVFVAALIEPLLSPPLPPTFLDNSSLWNFATCFQKIFIFTRPCLPHLQLTSYLSVIKLSNNILRKRKYLYK